MLKSEKLVKHTAQRAHTRTQKRLNYTYNWKGHALTPEDIQRKLLSLCMPYAVEKMNEAREKGIKFAHYTSAYAALQIIEKKTVWMRNAVIMNDFSEVQHGQSCLKYSWDDENAGGRLRNLLDRLQPGLAQAVAQKFDGYLHDREVQSYLISVSEHGDKVLDEDKYGRLSMWRAYGGSTNVALIFNSKPFFSEANTLNAFTSPVFYCDRERFNEYFIAVVTSLEGNFDLLKQAGPEEVEGVLNWAFHFAVLSIKHPGFSEEREWRIIHSPTIHPSDKVRFDIETIDGVPQRVYKLRLEDNPDEGFVGSNLSDSLEEIIIGPTASPWPIYDALGTKLMEIGVQDAWSKVRTSNIPLRR